MFDALIAGLAYGSDVRLLVAGGATGGRLAVLELRVGRATPLPRHLHANEDELIYVLDGHLTCDTGGALVDLFAGGSVFLPRGEEHALRVESASARLLLVVTPAGLEGYCDELDATAAPDVERLVATAARYGVAITGPGG